MSASGLALPCGEGSGRRVSVLLHHADDGGVNAALDVCQQLSLAGQLRPFACVTYSAPAVDSPASLDLGRSTRLLEDGTWAPAGLMYTLHHLGELSRIDVVVVCTAALALHQQQELAAAGELLGTDLNRVAPASTSVQLHRVWAPDFGEDRLAPSPEFVHGAPAGIFVVLPVDREFERAVAMPVSSSDAAEVHGWHVAVEVASLAGLWSTMVGAPLELADVVTSGTGRPLVRLTRSALRAARIQTPSPAQTLEDEGLLPLPPGLLPAPDPHYLARAAAFHVFPEAFRLRDESDSERHASTSTPHDAWQSDRPHLMPHAQSPSRMLLAAEALDTVLARGDDVAEAAKRLDEFATDVMHAVPWTSALIDPSGSLRAADNESAQGSPGVDDEPDTIGGQRRELRAVAHARQRLYDELPPVSLEGVPTSGWDELIASCLGVADASSAFSGARTAAVGEKLVALDRHSIAPEPRPGPAGLATVVDQIVEQADTAAHRHYRKTGLDGQLVDVAVSAAEDDSRPDASPDDAPPAAADVDGHGDVSPGPHDEEPHSLVVGVTREFNDEIRRCKSRVTLHLRTLRDHLSPDQRPEPGVTSFVAYALLASLLIGTGAALTLTGLRELFSPDLLSDELRVMSFGIVSLLAALAPVLRLTPARSLSAQIRLVLVAGGFAAAVAAVAVLAGPISRSALDRPGQWMPAIVLVAAVGGLGIVAWMRDFSGDRTLLGPLAPLVADRVASVVPLIYVFVIAVASLNYDATAPALFEQRSWRLLTVLLAGAASVAVAAGGLVRIIRRRDRRVVSGWKSGLLELVDQCELACARVKAMELLRRHWLMTAALVARLVHRPFGSSERAESLQDPTPAVRKLLMLDLDLTDATRDAFLAELLPELAPRGWLNQRYRDMSERFVDAERTRLGMDDPSLLPPPEHCTYPLLAVPPGSGENHGYRWRFAEQAYRGEFDELLSRSADGALADALAATFMNERAAVSTAVADTRSRSLPSLLGELLPTGERRLPAGMLPPRVDDAPSFTPYLWWPHEVSKPEAGEPSEYICIPERNGGTVLFHVVRVDISEALEIDRLEPLAEPGSAPVEPEPDPGGRVSALREPLM